jgi:hypothetical protein
MRYTVPLLLDEKGEPAGVLSVNTSAGMVVIIFSSSIRWEAFANPVARALAKKGQRLGSAEVDAPSIEAVVSRLAKMDPTITNDATFVLDTMPMFSDVVRFFQSEA